MKKQKNLSALLVFNLILLSSFSSFEPGILREDPIVTIIIQNSTSNLLSVSTDENFYNLNDSQRFITKRKDTVTIPIKGYGYIYYSHKNTFVDTILVSQNDTVVLDAQNDRISAFVKNKKNSFTLHQAEDDFADYKQSARLRFKIDSTTNLFFKKLNLQPMVVANEYSKRFLSSAPDPNLVYYKNNYKGFGELVDLLLQQYHLKEAYYSSTPIPAELRLLLVSKSKYELFLTLTEYYQAFSSNAALDLATGNTFINDALLNDPFGKKILNAYLPLKIIKQAPDWSKSRKYIDYKIAYNNAPAFLKGDLLRYARFLCIENMVSNEEPFIELQQKFQNFKGIYQDSRLNKILESRYLFDVAAYANIVNDIQLVDSKKRLFSLNELIRKSKGKLVYIDFWASWCAPCREAMPASNKLKLEYQRKGVTFIYLSIDKSINPWIQANNSEKLPEAISFLILNKEKALFLKDIGLKLIPRYLLFDKSGKLVHQNAPGPDGPAIRLLLNKYLAL